MLWFFFELATVVVGAILPMFRTWKVLKSRRSRQLIPLSKYWIVFASWVSLESVANVFSLPYFIPAYPFLKFTVVLYTSIFGYEQIYQKFVSPFLQEYEPNKDVLMASAQFYASRATQHALTYAWSTLTSHSTPRTKAIASTNVDQNHCEFPPVVKIVEFEEQEDFTELEEPEEPFDDLDAESDTEIENVWFCSNANPSAPISPVETVTDSHDVQFAPNFLFGAQQANNRRSFGTPAARKVQNYGSPGILKSREMGSGPGKSVHWSPVLVRERSKSPADEKKFSSARQGSQNGKNATSALWNGPPLRSLNEDVVGPPEKLFRPDRPSSNDLVTSVQHKSGDLSVDTVSSPAELRHWNVMESDAVEMQDEQQQLEDEEENCYWLFSRHGHIMAQKTSKHGNWVHIRYSSPVHANQALVKNASIFQGQMIGVVPCKDREALEEESARSQNALPLIPQHSNVSAAHDHSQNGSLLLMDDSFSLFNDSRMVPSTSQHKPNNNNLPSRARLSISSRAGMRPLNASAISDSADHSMDLSFQRSAAGGENDSFMGKLWTMLSNVSTGSNGGG
uniref:Nucleoporin NUP35 n=1 Tax=Globodera rostochiensis TaxID=31243 RepID=A0A914ICP1_GLORO